MALRIFEPTFTPGQIAAGLTAQKLRHDSRKERDARKLMERAYFASLAFPNDLGGYDRIERLIARAKRAELKQRKPFGPVEHRFMLASAFSFGPVPVARPRKVARGKRAKRDLRIGVDGRGLPKFLPPASFGKKRIIGVRVEGNEYPPDGPRDAINNSDWRLRLIILGKPCRVADEHFRQTLISQSRRDKMPRDLSVNAVAFRRGMCLIASGNSGFPVIAA